MWITLALLLLLFGGMLAFSLGERFYFSKSGKLSIQKLDVFSVGFLSLSIVVGGTLLYGCNSHLPIYTWLFMLLLLWALFYFAKSNWTPRQKMLFRLSLCAVGTFGILMPAPQLDILYWLMGIVFIVSWLVGWRIVSNFDKFPMTSYLVSSGWCVALLVVYCILSNFPPEICLFAAILGVSVYVICRKRLSYGIANLGPYTAEVVGFIWSGVWTICLLATNVVVISLFYAYYLMEMFVLLIKHLKKRPMETLLFQALANDKKRKRAITLVFFHVVVMTILAAFLTVSFDNPRLSISTSFVFGFVICLNLYNHLKDLDHPIGTWKDIFSELKKGFSELPKASKSFAKEVKSGLKTQTRKKKTSAKKPVRKKKGTQKKK